MANIKPSIHFVELIASLINKNPTPIRIAEIGVDCGATTREIVNLLRRDDIYDLFDVSDCTLFSNFDKIITSGHCAVNIFGNTRKLYDSYAWTIANLYMKLVDEAKNTHIWYAVYIDGAHSFSVDAPTTCCVKEMIKSGGFIVFDDMKWSFAKSPTCNTETMRGRYTVEQMNKPHVALIVNVFMRSDPRFVEISKIGESCAVFSKIK